MKVYVLFQTDAYRSYSSRVLFGVFSTEQEAVESAEENDLYEQGSCCVDIVECELNEFLPGE